MIELIVKKPLYTDKDMLEMFGFSKKKMRELRSKGIINYCNTRPVRYTHKMIDEFLKTIDSNPNIISSAYYKNL